MVTYLRTDMVTTCNNTVKDDKVACKLNWYKLNEYYEQIIQSPCRKPKDVKSIVAKHKM